MLDHLFLESATPVGWTLAAIVAAVALVSVSAFRWLGWNRGSVLLLLARVLFFLLLAWCMARPMRRHAVTEWLRPRFVVALDVSESMRQSPADDVPSRRESALRVLEGSWVKKLAGQCELDAVAFADVTRPVPGIEALAGESAFGKATHLRQTLNGLADRYRAQRVAGILLLSDGLETRDVGSDWVNTEWPCPIYTVRLEPVVERVSQPDVRVSRVETATRAVVGWEGQLTAVVEATGTEGRPFAVQLWRGDVLVREQTVQIPREGGQREARFRLSHDMVGSFRYAVVAPPLPGEVSTNDNQQAANVQVVDARNRLLYVENTARFESKYLNRVLKASRDVTPVAFMKGPGGQFLSYGDRAGVTTELKLEDLTQFKVVIVGDLDGGTLGEQRAADLAQYARQGGSLVLLGGPNGWGRDGFGGTALQQVMPLRTVGHAPVVERRMPVVLTPEGRAHPMFLMADGAAVSMPPVLSVFPAQSPSPAAVVLASVQADTGMLPLIAAQRVGEGKVVMILTDSLWRWQLEPGQDEPYARFWNQMLNWLKPSEAELEPFTLDLTAATDRLFLGETLALTARVAGGRDTESPSANVTCVVQRPDGRRIPFAMTRQKEGDDAAGRKHPAFGIDYDAESPGDHVAVATAQIDGKTVESAPFGFHVQPFTVETSPQPANTALLQAIAKASGGRYCGMDEVSEVLAGIEARPESDQRVTYSTMWNTIAMISLLMGLLAVEWLARKWRNLP